MGLFLPLLFLFLSSLLLHNTYASDRTNWAHVCGSDFKLTDLCDSRKSLTISLNKIAPELDKPISPMEEDPKFTECWDYIFFKRNRTNEVFKERVESALGTSLKDYVNRVNNSVNDLAKHDDLAVTLIKHVQDWSECLEENTEQECASQAEILLKHFNSAVKTNISSLQLQNVKARLTHLEQRNKIRIAAANLIHSFRKVVADVRVFTIDWSECLEENTEQECASQAEILLKHFNSAVKTNISSLHLQNVKARLTHLEQRNKIRIAAANLIHSFRKVVADAFSRLTEGEYVNDHWYKKCSEQFNTTELPGEEKLKTALNHTRFTDRLNNETIAMIKDLHDIERIESRTEEYLKQLEAFRTCEISKGKYEFECASSRIQADEIDSRYMELSETQPGILAMNRKQDMKEREKNHRQLVTSFRANKGGLLQAYTGYQEETNSVFSDFFSSVENTISKATNKIKETGSSVIEKLKTIGSCKRTIEEHEIPVATEANELSRIRNITKNIMHIRAKFAHYMSHVLDYEECMAKNQPKSCDDANVDVQRSAFLASVKEASWTEAERNRQRRWMKPYDATERAMARRNWDENWAKLGSWMDDLKASGDHAWITFTNAPSKLLAKLSGDANCDQQMHAGKSEVHVDEMKNFDDSLTNTKSVFEKLNERLIKEHIIVELFVKIAVCTDEDEFSCRYLAKEIDELLTN